MVLPYKADFGRIVSGVPVSQQEKKKKNSADKKMTHSIWVSQFQGPGIVHNGSLSWQGGRVDGTKPSLTKLFHLCYDKSKRLKLFPAQRLVCTERTHATIHLPLKQLVNTTTWALLPARPAWTACSFSFLQPRLRDIWTGFKSASHVINLRGNRLSHHAQ